MSRRYETVEDTTTSAFRDGWFYSGDEGILFADGLFAIAGRISETFNLMGLKVSISDLETELLQTRLVKDVAAVMIELKGVDHLAFAVICDSREDALALGRRARRRIPSGVPVRVARVRDIPRNAMGKVMRPALKAQLSEFFARAGARKAKTSSY